jgi:hypothetical protein
MELTRRNQSRAGDGRVRGQDAGLTRVPLGRRGRRVPYRTRLLTNRYLQAWEGKSRPGYAC